MSLGPINLLSVETATEVKNRVTIFPDSIVHFVAKKSHDSTYAEGYLRLHEKAYEWKGRETVWLASLLQPNEVTGGLESNPKFNYIFYKTSRKDYEVEWELAHSLDVRFKRTAPPTPAIQYYSYGTHHQVSYIHTPESVEECQKQHYAKGGVLETLCGAAKPVVGKSYRTVLNFTIMQSYELLTEVSLVCGPYADARYFYESMNIVAQLARIAHEDVVPECFGITDRVTTAGEEHPGKLVIVEFRGFDELAANPVIRLDDDDVSSDGETDDEEREDEDVQVKDEAREESEEPMDGAGREDMAQRDGERRRNERRLVTHIRAGLFTLPWQLLKMIMDGLKEKEVAGVPFGWSEDSYVLLKSMYVISEEADDVPLRVELETCKLAMCWLSMLARKYGNKLSTFKQWPVKYFSSDIITRELAGDPSTTKIKDLISEICVDQFLSIFSDRTYKTALTGDAKRFADIIRPYLILPKEFAKQRCNVVFLALKSDPVEVPSREEIEEILSSKFSGPDDRAERQDLGEISITTSVYLGYKKKAPTFTGQQAVTVRGQQALPLQPVPPQRGSHTARPVVAGHPPIAPVVNSALSVNCSPQRPLNSQPKSFEAQSASGSSNSRQPNASSSGTSGGRVARAGPSSSSSSSSARLASSSSTVGARVGRPGASFSSTTSRSAGARVAPASSSSTMPTASSSRSAGSSLPSTGPSSSSTEAQQAPSNPAATSVPRLPAPTPRQGRPSQRPTQPIIPQSLDPSASHPSRAGPSTPSAAPAAPDTRQICSSTIVGEFVPDEEAPVATGFSTPDIAPATSPSTPARAPVAKTTPIDSSASATTSNNHSPKETRTPPSATSPAQCPPPSAGPSSPTRRNPTSPLARSSSSSSRSSSSPSSTRHKPSRLRRLSPTLTPVFRPLRASEIPAPSLSPTPSVSSPIQSGSASQVPNPAPPAPSSDTDILMDSEEERVKLPAAVAVAAVVQAPLAPPTSSRASQSTPISPPKQNVDSDIVMDSEEERLKQAQAAKEARKRPRQTPPSGDEIEGVGSRRGKETAVAVPSEARRKGARSGVPGMEKRKGKGKVAGPSGGGRRGAVSADMGTGNAVAGLSRPRPRVGINGSGAKYADHGQGKRRRLLTRPTTARVTKFSYRERSTSSSCSDKDESGVEGPAPERSPSIEILDEPPKDMGKGKAKDKGKGKASPEEVRRDEEAAWVASWDSEEGDVIYLDSGNKLVSQRGDEDLLELWLRDPTDDPTYTETHASDLSTEKPLRRVWVCGNLHCMHQTPKTGPFRSFLEPEMLQHLRECYKIERVQLTPVVLGRKEQEVNRSVWEYARVWQEDLVEEMEVDALFGN